MINGIVYIKYYFFYLSTFISVFTIFLFLYISDIKVKFNFCDILVFIFALYVFILFCILGFDYTNKICLLGLIVICYFFIRIFFILTNVNVFIFELLVIILGVIEGGWGLLQLYGIVSVYNPVFSITGSFFNPGQLGGYLSIVVPINLHLLFKYFELKEYKVKFVLLKYFLILSLFVILLIIPATMSRSAWLALIIGSVYVIFVYYKQYVKRLLNLFARNNYINILLIVFVVIFFLIVVVLLYYIKPKSVISRLYIWKYLLLGLLENGRWQGYGLGHFSEVYAQIKISSLDVIDDNSSLMKIIDFPEYAFNEYIQIYIELGLIGLFFYLSFLVFFIIVGVKYKKYGLVGSLIAFSVYSFFSYPFSVLPLCLLFINILAIISSNVDIKTVFVPIKSKVLAFLIVLSYVPFGFYGYNFCLSIFKWNTARFYSYKMKIVEYEKIYPFLKDQYLFSLSYAKALRSMSYYSDSNEVITQMKKYSCDPQIYILYGMNCENLKFYKKAETSYFESYIIVPNRIYPLYLLALLYKKEGELVKMKNIAYKIINKEPKFYTMKVVDIKKEMSDLIYELDSD